MRAKEFITEVLDRQTEDFWAEISDFNVHHAAMKERCREYRQTITEGDAKELRGIKEFFGATVSAEPIVGEVYLCAVVACALHPAFKMMNFAKFTEPHKLARMDHGRMWFEGVNQVIPVPGDHDKGDMLQYVWLFDSLREMKMFETIMILKFKNTDWRYSTKLMDSTLESMSEFRTFTENCSVGATSSGSVATVGMPLGGTISRGGSLMSPQATDEEFPNTPKHIRDQAKKWKSSNKNK